MLKTIVKYQKAFSRSIEKLKTNEDFKNDRGKCILHIVLEVI